MNAMKNRIELTRNQLAHLSATGNIARFDGADVVVTLQGEMYAGKLEAYSNGTSIVHFAIPGIYFNQNSMEITSKLNNNYASHALEAMSTKR